MSVPEAENVQELPGDAQDVKQHGSRFTAAAEAINDAARELRRLAAENEDGLSDALAALVNVAGDVASRLDKVHGRYEVAGSQLLHYGNELDEAQQMAHRAVVDVRGADGPSSYNSSMSRQYAQQAASAPSPEEKQQAQDAADRYGREASAADDVLQAAVTLYKAALEKRDNAAKRAADKIAGAVDHDDLNDSRWDDFTGWVADHADILKAIKDVLSKFAVVLSVLSIFFPVLAPFALVAAGLTAALSLVLAASGQISWTEFGLDLLTVAALGVGAVGGAALKGTMATLKSSRVATVTAQNTGKSALRQVTGSFNGVLPSKVGLVNKAKWAKEVYSSKSIVNAKALRVLNNSRVGAGTAADNAIVRTARNQLGMVKGAAAVNGVAHQVDGGLRNAERITSLLPDPLAQAGNNVTDWYSGVHKNATWRVGSNW